MPNVTLYSFKTSQRTIVPLEELAPGWLKVTLRHDGGGPDETVWVNAAEIPRGELRHPPFGENRRRLLREIQLTLREVHPLTLEEWELGFRCDLNPDKEITVWRWIAHTFRRITNDGRFSRARRRDLFKLLLGWVNHRKVEEVLATTLPLAAIPEPEARKYLEVFRYTSLDFFGGATERIARTFGLRPHQIHALDYGSIASTDEFRALVGPKDFIVAVDYSTGHNQMLFGCEHILRAANAGQAEVQHQAALDPMAGTGVTRLQTIGGRRLSYVIFALNFDAELPGGDGGTEFDHICAAVRVVKGAYWVNFERHPPI